MSRRYASADGQPLVGVEVHDFLSGANTFVEADEDGAVTLTEAQADWVANHSGAAVTELDAPKPRAKPKDKE